MKHHLKLKNEGALETEVVFKNKKGVPLGQLYDLSTMQSMSSKGAGSRTPRGQQAKPDYDHEEEKIMSQLKFDKKTKIKGYSELLIPIEYTPTEIGSVDYDIIVYFENFLHSPPIEVTIR